MPSLFVLFTVLLSVAVTSTVGQNVTVDDSSSQIVYSTSPGWLQAKPCVVNGNGTFEAGQSGCINLANNCTDGVMLAITVGASASFTFQGTAISYFGVNNRASGLITVALDGDSTDVDAFDPSGPLVCKTTFSKTGLTLGMSHTITVTLKAVSPQASDGSSMITLDQFIVTTGESSSNSSSSVTASASSSASSPASSNTSSRTATGVSAGLANFVLALFLACTATPVVL